MFQIIERFPVYCQITDGLIGSSGRRLPMAYRSQALAEKLASRLSQASYESCGDSSFSVVKYGEHSPCPRAQAVAHAAAVDAAEMPF
jgi:hypothetical protein